MRSRPLSLAIADDGVLIAEADRPRSVRVTWVSRDGKTVTRASVGNTGRVEDARLSWSGADARLVYQTFDGAGMRTFLVHLDRSGAPVAGSEVEVARAAPPGETAALGAALGVLP